MLEKTRPTVSVIIKAFNEERHIAAAIESALAALAGIDGEVILADGASTDRTVAIAKTYPVKIVSLNNPEDRSCGSGAQLGYQYSRGTYVCLMDGDMRLHADFIAAGVAFLDQQPGVAGVGGGVVDREVGNLEYAQRAKRYDPDRRPGPVTRLNSSGLYRRSAIESVGYVTDRNLHGGEELDLAARLHARGWTLARIDCHAIDHYGYGENTYGLLLRRIKTRNAFGPGEVIRASLGRPHFAFVARHDRNSWLCGLVGGWWACIAAVAALANGPIAMLAIAALGALPFAAMSWRWRSVRHGLYTVSVWNSQALCFLPGLLRRRAPPTAWLDSTVIQDPLVTPDSSYATHP